MRSYIAAKILNSQKKAWCHQPACKIKPARFMKNKFDIYIGITWCMIGVYC